MVSNNQAIDEISKRKGLTADMSDFLSEQGMDKRLPLFVDSDPVQAREVSVWSDDPVTFAELFDAENPVYYDERDRWYAWNAHKNSYVNLDELDVIRLVQQSLKPIRDDLERDRNDAYARKEHKEAQQIEKKLKAMSVTGRSRTEILNAIQIVARSRYYRLEKPEWYEVQFGRELWNLRTGDRRPVHPSILVKNPIPWVPKQGPTPNIDRILSEWVPEDEVLMLEELCAFCMVPRYFVKKIFWLLGGGNNGKSSFLKFLTTLIGLHNSTSSDLTEMEKNRFETSALLDKLLCVVNEVDHKTIWQNRMAKAISGEDEIRIEEKNKPVKTGVVYAKIVIAANQLPRRTDYSNANMSRFVGIKFPNTFERQDVDPLDLITKEEYEFFVGHLVHDILIGGLINRRTFTKEKPLDEKELDYDRQSDSLYAFIREHVDEEQSEDDYLERREFYDRYESYCRSMGLRHDTFRKTNGRLKGDFGWDLAQPRTDGSQDRMRAWRGVTWKKHKRSNEDVYRFIRDKGGVRMIDLLDEYGTSIEPILKSLLETGDVYEHKPGEYKVV